MKAINLFVAFNVEHVIEFHLINRKKKTRKNMAMKQREISGKYRVLGEGVHFYKKTKRK